MFTATELTAFISFLLSKLLSTLFTAVICRFDLFRISRIHIPKNRYISSINKEIRKLKFLVIFFIFLFIVNLQEAMRAHSRKWAMEQKLLTCPRSTSVIYRPTVGIEIESPDLHPTFTLLTTRLRTHVYPCSYNYISLEILSLIIPGSLERHLAPC